MQDRLAGIVEWYQHRLGWEIVIPNLINVPKHLNNSSFKPLLMVPPIRSWDELNQDALEQSRDMALEKLITNPRYAHFGNSHITQAFGELARQSIEEFQAKYQGSQELKEFTEQSTGDRIFLFDSFIELYQNALDSGPAVIVDSFLAHELLHIEQEKRGLNEKYPYFKEGPAWVLQLLYGADQIGINEYIECFEQFNNEQQVNADPNKRISQYHQTVEVEVKVLIERLDLKLNENIGDQLQKFQTIFEQPRYSLMQAQVMYNQAFQVIQ
jgi:hypothetical protein